jgi:hypothetical protein
VVAERRGRRIGRGQTRADAAIKIRPTRHQERVDIIGALDIAGRRGREADLADAIGEVRMDGTPAHGLPHPPRLSHSDVDPKGANSQGEALIPLGPAAKADNRAFMAMCHGDWTDGMPLLFSYGTLQTEAVQISTFGRLLQGQPDEIIGFEKSLLRVEDPQFVATSGKTHHAIVKFNGRNDCRVHGTVFEVSEIELVRADQYEPAGYKRIIALLASGKQAWVYADACLCE